MTCDLCEAARITPWFHEDDVCWVAECEFCDVPMVVWKVHASAPDDATKAYLHERLTEVATAQLGAPFWIDDNMRNIPDHYHAHARRRLGGTFLKQ